ncbi:MAG: hypothetical protein AAFP84_10250 [Actinomycetota bacterium]
MTNADGDTFDAWLDAAGFDADPDALLTGRAADEVAAAGDADDLGDPWAELITEPGALTDAQVGFVIESNPTLGAALRGGTLLADAPFAELPDDAIASADEAIIEIDPTAHDDPDSPAGSGDPAR